jgi:hypothetical protein
MYAQKLTRLATEASIRDLAMYNYNRRQLYEVSEDGINGAVSKLRPAGNFYYSGKAWVPNEYKGFAVVSMLNDNPGNEPLTDVLINVQKELQDNLRPLDGFYMLPPESFHQTIANTLSDDRFKDNIIRPGLEGNYPGMVRNAFSNITTFKQPTPIKMRIVGLSIFGTAIGALGTFEMDADYNRILDFRSGFYEDPQLASLDIKMTRPFIGHITLAYAEQKLNKNQRDHMANTINEINAQVFSKKHYFLISNTGLRRYDHLAEFNNAPNFPVYQFTL